MRHYLEEFEAFWSAYPRRVGNPKDAARKQWMRIAHAGQLPELGDMIAAAKAYAAYVKRENIQGEYIAHTRTWLFQKRFLDWKPDADTPVLRELPRDAMDAVPACLKTYVAKNPLVWEHYLRNCQFEITDDTMRIKTKSSFDADRLERFCLSDLRAFTHREVAIESTAKEKGPRFDGSIPESRSAE